MSTSAVAIGKIEMQMRKKEPLPSLGWALGEDGKPTTDAREAFYKGAGVTILERYFILLFEYCKVTEGEQLEGVRTFRQITISAATNKTRTIST